MTRFARRCALRFLALVPALSVLIVSVVPTCPGSAAEVPEAGLVQDEPQQGRSVKTSRGFMVGYTTTIPGSDVTFTVVPIPGGEFTMGSPESEQGRSDSEGPQFVAVVEPFWMGIHEVTWAEYKQYMALHDIFRAFDAKAIRKVTAERKLDAVTAPSKLYDPDTTFQSGDDPRQPAVMMTQYAAKQYTKWLSGVTGKFYRLPSEAEWEYACRAGSVSAFHFGDDASMLGEYAWWIKNSAGRSHRVGQKKRNPWGLYDMHGNVAEWVLDAYTEDGYARFKGQRVAGQNAIRWPTELFPRVLRGGSFEMKPEQCRSAARLGSDDEEWKMDDPNLPASPWWFTTSPATGVGFRIVRPLAVPGGAAARERFWMADIEEIAEDVESRIDDQESGAIGIVDKELPSAIERIRQK